MLIIQAANPVSQSAVSDRMTEEPLRIQHGVRHLAELEARECAARFEDTVGLLQYCGYGRAIPDTKRDGVQIVRV